jgi:hypothetical protein
MRPSTPKAPTASLPPLLLRLLPGGANAGRELHPLESIAFSRRTVTSTMKDYPVIEINDKTVKARLRDKQGKHQTDMLDVRHR